MMIVNEVQTLHWEFYNDSYYTLFNTTFAIKNARVYKLCERICKHANEHKSQS